MHCLLMCLLPALPALLAVPVNGSTSGVRKTAQVPAAPPLPGVGVHNFALGTDDFLLDGKPFQIRSGEMHPARIPHRYWRHRLRMAKAMGLNAVAIYLFWSSYETAPDKYDFSTGERNVGEFLKIAKEEGLWVILRPGPYCCGEWDLGGIPTRLLKTPDIKLRCSDPRYTEPVARYLRRLAKVVRPHLVENGGPILMLQIENEYGSYPRRDRAYMVWLREQWVENGVKGPFYTADGAGESYLQGVVLPGVAVGLDSGLSPEDFAIGRKMNPGVPVFSSQTYPGWLRHWGEGDWHPNDISGALKFYMATGKSFNLYMFHGGTNFGFTAGANSDGEGYNPDVTSYDYGSPVDEQGRATPEYWKYRELLAAALPPGEKLPDVPAPVPATVLPEIKLERWSSIWAHLKQPAANREPECFESLDQNQGLVVYGIHISAGGKRELSFANLHDYGLVFVDGAYVGTVDRRKGEHSIELPACARDAVLEILVEGMGHINFAIEMETDRKGIYGDVLLFGTKLENWEMVPVPLTDKWATTLPKAPAPDGRPGGVFKGRFVMDSPEDTYLDMSRRQKGVVWVNGHNLGRYWRIGPQQRLYCPAPWLVKGENTIVVLDLHLTEPHPVTGHETARD